MKVTTLRANILGEIPVQQKYEQARCSWKQQIYATFEIIGACKVENHIDIAISYEMCSYCHGLFFFAFPFNDEQQKSSCVQGGASFQQRELSKWDSKNVFANVKNTCTF